MSDFTCFLKKLFFPIFIVFALLSSTVSFASCSMAVVLGVPVTVSGNPVAIPGNITNTGTQQLSSIQLTFSVDGTQQGSQFVSLAPQESTNVAFSWNTTGLADGSVHTLILNGSDSTSCSGLITASNNAQTTFVIPQVCDQNPGINLSISSPTSNATLSGSTNITGSFASSGNDSITFGNLMVTVDNGAPIFNASSLAAFSVPLDTTTLSDGSHNIQVSITGTDNCTHNPVNGSATVAINVTNAHPAVYSCSGFTAPFDQALSLKSKVQRAIPLKMQLYDSNHNLVTNTSVAGPAPAVTISYQAQNSAAVDESTMLAPAGNSSTGNTFSYDPTSQSWQYNMDSTPFSAKGTYKIQAISADPSLYTISPTCTGTFVRQ